MPTHKCNDAKVDIHAHILPESWPDFQTRFGYPGWIQMKHTDKVNASGSRHSVMMHDDGRVFRPVEENLYSVSCRLKDMQRTGVTKQILSTVPVMFNYWAKGEDNEIVGRFLNDHIAEVVRQHPNKFIGLGTVPLQNVQLAIKELARCQYELGLNGVIIGTHVNDLSLGDSVFEPFWNAAEEYSMPLFIHPWDVCKANGRWTKYWLPHLVGMPAETTAAALTMAFTGVFERHPRLRVCFAHGGGSLPYLASRANHGFQVYPADMQHHVSNSPNQYLRRSPNVCADTLVHDINALRLALDYFGEDSLMLGSDYPFLLGEQEPGKLIDSCSEHQLSQTCKQKLLSVNALKFFNC